MFPGDSSYSLIGGDLVATLAIAANHHRFFAVTELVARSTNHCGRTRKLTQEDHEYAADPQPGCHYAYDNVLPGFGCRVTPNGARSWIVEYRPHGGGRSSLTKRHVQLRSVLVLTPNQAREAAGDVLAKVQFGEDAPHNRSASRSSPIVADLVGSVS